MDGAAPELPGLGSSLGWSLVSLGIVCLAAWGVLRWLSKRGVGQAAGAIRVLARCPLEGRRSVYIVEAAGRCFLIGAGEGALSLLAELDGDKIGRAGAPESAAARPSRRFAELMARVLGGAPPPPPRGSTAGGDKGGAG
jgi:flagellar biosynthetic protein FliO